MKRIKLTEAAKMLGINEWTLRRWVYAGKVPVIRSDSGRVFVPEWWLKQQTGSWDAEKPAESVRAALYVRESSSENKAALESQKAGLIAFATAKGWNIVHVVDEFGSGVNDLLAGGLTPMILCSDFKTCHKNRMLTFLR
jgi:predicted site-specific integrase-resolvase